MSKTVRGFEVGEDGRMHHFAGKETRQARKSTLREIPWTPGPQTRWQRFKRAAVG